MFNAEILIPWSKKYSVDIHPTSRWDTLILKIEPDDLSSEMTCFRGNKNHYFKFVRPAKIENAYRCCLQKGFYACLDSIPG